MLKVLAENSRRDGRVGGRSRVVREGRKLVEIVCKPVEARESVVSVGMRRDCRVVSGVAERFNDLIVLF